MTVTCKMRDKTEKVPVRNSTGTFLRDRETHEPPFRCPEAARFVVVVAPGLG
jgi:hypothetical protein